MFAHCYILRILTSNNCFKSFFKVNYLARNLPIAQVIRCLVPFLARQLEDGRSKHAAFYVAWTDAILNSHAMTLRRELANVAQPRSADIKLAGLVGEVPDVQESEQAERLKKPGVLLERGEWRAFQASLVRLQASLDSLKGSLLNRLVIIFK